MGMRISKDRKLLFNLDKSGGSAGQQKPVVDQHTHFFGLIKTAARTSKRTTAPTPTPLSTPNLDETAPSVKGNVAPRLDASTLKHFLGRSESIKRLHEGAKDNPDLLKAVSDLDQKQAELDARWDRVSKLVRGEASQSGEDVRAAGALAPGSRYRAGSYPDVTDPEEAAMISRVVRQTNPALNKRNPTQVSPSMSRAGLQSNGAVAKKQEMSAAEWLARVNGTYQKPEEQHPALRDEPPIALSPDLGITQTSNSRLHLPSPKPKK